MSTQNKIVVSTFLAKLEKLWNMRILINF
uniref:Uncharacterized protein n=1 Tax=Heterorhabditis bacteriophora TaxID=37862 RepID=A0A1I7WNW1_HETBA